MTRHAWCVQTPPQAKQQKRPLIYVSPAATLGVINMRAAMVDPKEIVIHGFFVCLFVSLLNV